MMMATETTKSRDLLRRFAGTVGGDGPSPMSVADGGGEVELSLGLSLNGCFGVDKNKKGLVRSSSVTTFSMLPVENDGCGSELGLTRTCSLPTEMEEERRKRTEIQSLKRRMEAKRKRTEKQQSRAATATATAATATATATVKGENLNLNLNLNLDEEKKKADVVNGPAKWAVVGYGGTKPISQGSIGSQGSSCSGVSDFDSHPMQQARSPSTRPPLADQPPNLLQGKPRNHSREEEEDEGRMKRNCTNAKSNGVKEMERNMMEEMPCVSTRGDGPNGRRIEGFLYKYRSGDEVRIVCVCCGKFLTPAEFVKHAGGGDVDNPLRHIVVNSAPAAFV